MVSHKVIVRNLVLICLGMFAFGFALVPLYDVLCSVTGINGKTKNTAAAASTSVDASRQITVEFLANRDPGMSWEFTPKTESIELNPGQIKTVNFYVANPTGEAMVAHAVPSISPGEAALYFKKIECFCFTEQALGAHENKLMPVQFYIDPKLPSQFTTITLSYRLYDSTPRTVSR
jgi:cytochrome c oxidase assembly protein subunit 11